MSWIVFSYSLPSKAQSSPRVAMWRRLRRLGAVSPKSGVYVLPSREECMEAFQWLAQEVRQAGGESLVMHVERFEGLDESQLRELFNQVRAEEYAEIRRQVEQLQQVLLESSPEVHAQPRETLARLYKRHGEVMHIDFFGCPEATEVAALLARTRQLLPGTTAQTHPDHRTIEQYQGKGWVTRPHPHVDRLACIWLIRRFIDREAQVRYSSDPLPGEIAFDMKEGEFTHQGNLCTFEVMVAAFGLQDPGLAFVAQIVHELDLRDGLYVRPETPGIDAVIRGWSLEGLPDTQLEAHGIVLFQGLFATLGREEV